MTTAKFIGGGFPGIKECINEKIIMSNSREKREFSVRKLIPINQILLQNKNADIKHTNSTEKLNVKEHFIYDNISDITHNNYTGSIPQDSERIINKKRSSSKNKSSSKRKNKSSLKRKNKSK